MKLTIYAVMDKCANALVRFAFGSNDSSFVRDNLPSDIYNKDTQRGLPFNDLEYRSLGYVDTETFEIEPFNEPKIVDIMKSYQFKTENPTKKNEDKK